jgi:hypothetical protein
VYVIDSTPEPVSVAARLSIVVPGTHPDADGAGVVVALADGTLLSTSKGPNGPTVAQLPTSSHTVAVFVDAAAVAVPAGTVVVTVVVDCEGEARPDRASVTMQGTDTSWLDQATGGTAHVTVGAVASTFTVTVAVDETLPARSVAVNTNVVVPWAVRSSDVATESGSVAPAANMLPLPAWAPVAR